MRKISIFLGVLFSCLFFTSCHEEVENWDSAVLDYSGRYVVRMLDEDGELNWDYDGTEIQLYNTAANLANEMWIDDFGYIFPLKTKISFEGTTADFHSVETGYEKLTDSEYAISSPSGSPTGEGVVKVVPNYYRAALLEGKITPKGFTTKGGNVTDAISLKLKLYVAAFTFTSVTKPEATWADPTKPEYAWELTSIEYVPEYDEVCTLEGYRYTGYAEDDF